MLLDALGNGHVDGRLTLRTSDGCHISMQYPGVARVEGRLVPGAAEYRIFEAHP